MKSKWFEFYPKRPEANVRLFCFHHLGSNANWCNQWRNHLPETIEVIGVALPGRLRRFSEPSAENLKELALTIAQEGLELFREKPFAFLGNSMGSLLSFEVIHALRKKRGPMPVHYFPCAAIPPHKRTKTSIKNMIDYKNASKADIIDLMRKNGGTSEEVLKHEEMMDLLIQPIRADGILYQSYKYEEYPKLEIPISYSGSMMDNLMTDPEVQKFWGDLTTHKCDSEIFPAESHFFLVTTKTKEILQKVAQTLGQ